MTTTAAYDGIATDYQKSKELPFRTYAEAPLLASLLGDLRGKRVLDLACGEGIYARKLKQLGAAQVVGVDISSAMIQLAQAAEAKESHGIKYHVADAALVGKLGAFDVVLGSYLLNYARTPDQLAAFCQTVVANLSSGGRFVGMNDNPACQVANYPSYRKYGFIKSSPSPRCEGDPVTYTMFREDGTSFSFDNYYLASETYASITRDYFREFNWRVPTVIPAGLEALGLEYWREFTADPPVIGFEAMV